MTKKQTTKKKTRKPTALETVSLIILAPVAVYNSYEKMLANILISFLMILMFLTIIQLLLEALYPSKSVEKEIFSNKLQKFCEKYFLLIAFILVIILRKLNKV